MGGCDAWPVIGKNAFLNHQAHGREGQAGVFKRALAQEVGSPACSVHHLLLIGDFGWVIALRNLSFPIYRMSTTTSYAMWAFVRMRRDKRSKS